MTLHEVFLWDLLIRIPDKLPARIVDPKSVIKMGPCELKAWIIPMRTELNKALPKAINSGNIDISGVEPHVQVAFEHASEQAWLHDSSQFAEQDSLQLWQNDSVQL
ncbi:hypothetical protein CEE45_08665 [Candidatus Heimdallarchaeota archaeon B3_Heim]|nr:MAG: hypothetical protein CEE45_08665 [Candidatus Heimdallarchaeota archaeon B3_Heim]